MKFPALALAASFASGILAAGSVFAGFPHAARLLLPFSAVFILFALALLSFRFPWTAFLAAMLAWFALGAAATKLESIPATQDRVDNLLARHEIELEQPLRWQGILRADPLALPWGIRYVIDLQAVQMEGRWMKLSGGMRTDYYFDEDLGSERTKEAASIAADLRAGDNVEFLVRARPVRNFGDPGAFDYRTFLARQDIYLTSTVRNITLIQKIAGPGPDIAHRLARWRGSLLRRIDSRFANSDDRTAVMRAMLLGDRSFLDSQEVEAFQKTGAYHILVLSGLQVGFLAATLLWVVRRVHLPILTGIALTLSTLWAYAMIVEDHPPILRAVLMASFYLFSYALFRRTHVLNASGLAAIAILALRPSEIYDASFLLSFVAVLAIGGVAVPLLERSAGIYLRALDHLSDVTRDGWHAPKAAQFRLDLRALQAWAAARVPALFFSFSGHLVTAPVRVGLWLWETIFLSAVIQLVMLPLMAQYFHRVSVVGLAASVPAVLLTGVIVPLGFLTFGVTALWQSAGNVFNYFLSMTLTALLNSIHFLARLEWASYRVPSPPAGFLIVFFFLAAVLMTTTLLASRRAAQIAALALVGCAAIIAIHPFSPRLNANQLEVNVLDIGQGDSLFVAFPHGRTMLIDGGGLPGSAYIRSQRPGIDVGEDVVSPYLWSRGLKRIDVVALTHGHQDHLGGLAAVLRNFKVGELWIGRDIESTAFRALIAEADQLGIPVVHHKRGEEMNWDGVRINVLWPDSLDAHKTAVNNDSLVLRLEDGSERLLLTGDIERPVERELVASGDALRADFLKVPHHGSRTSSTDPFLSAVHAQFAAVSVGDNNPFGHPNDDVLSRVEMAGARLYRTDRDGAITVTTDGKQMAVTTFWPSIKNP